MDETGVLFVCMNEVGQVQPFETAVRSWISSRGTSWEGNGAFPSYWHGLVIDVVTKPSNINSSAQQRGLLP
jgi:hypothetical protein